MWEASLSLVPRQLVLNAGAWKWSADIRKQLENALQEFKKTVVEIIFIAHRYSG